MRSCPLCIRVWFGEHVVATYVAEPDEAARSAEAMGRRFAGLVVTSDSLDPESPHSSAASPLPAAPLWELTP